MSLCCVICGLWSSDLGSDRFDICTECLRLNFPASQDLDRAPPHPPLDVSARAALEAFGETPTSSRHARCRPCGGWQSVGRRTRNKDMLYQGVMVQLRHKLTSLPRAANTRKALATFLCIGGAQDMVDHHSSIKRSARGQFLKGTHWRPPQPFRDKAWLLEEYSVKERSTGEIAAQFGVTDAAILFWLRKHEIPRRTIHEVRSVKHWGLTGEANPMFGKRGAEVPGWKGGITPLRNALYSSSAWQQAVQVVWSREQGHCQRCGKHDDREAQKSFHIHHIVHYSYVPLMAEPTNLVLLCHACHGWVHSKHNTEGRWMSDIPTTEEPS